MNAIPSSNLQSSDFFTRLICSLEVGKPLSLKSCKHKGHRLERLLKVSSFCGKFHRYDIRYSSRVGREFDSGTSNANDFTCLIPLSTSSAQRMFSLAAQIEVGFSEGGRTWTGFKFPNLVTQFCRWVFSRFRRTDTVPSSGKMKRGS